MVKSHENLVKSEEEHIELYLSFSRFFSVKSCFFQGLEYQLNLGSLSVKSWHAQDHESAQETKKMDSNYYLIDHH